MEATQVPFEPLDRIKAVVLDSVTSLETKRVYERAINKCLAWLRAEHPTAGFTKATVQAFRAHLVASGLSSSAINLYLTAVRRLATEAADSGVLSSEVAAAIGRVKGVKSEGVRTGNWLTVKQAEDLIKSANATTVKGRRDRALLAVMIGCGLRREEAASLQVEHIQERDGRWVVLDMVGKGRKIRSIPMPNWAKAAIDVWIEAAGFNTGTLFRPVNKGGKIAGGKMTGQSVFIAVKHYAAPLGFNIAAHDLRRTYARLAYDGGSTLEQIQLSLAHSSVTTTEKYVNVQQTLKNGPCDHLGLQL
jgi:site-specific recombinase XerD